MGLIYLLLSPEAHPDNKNLEEKRGGRWEKFERVENVLPRVQNNYGVWLDSAPYVMIDWPESRDHTTSRPCQKHKNP